MALFIAVQAFATERRGRSEMIQPGDVAGSRSWVVATYPDAFRPLEVRWPDPPDAAPDPKLELTADGQDGAAAKAHAQHAAVSPASLQRRGPGRPRKES